MYFQFKGLVECFYFSYIDVNVLLNPVTSFSFGGDVGIPVIDSGLSKCAAQMTMGPSEVIQRKLRGDNLA